MASNKKVYRAGVILKAKPRYQDTGIKNYQMPYLLLLEKIYEDPNLSMWKCLHLEDGSIQDYGELTLQYYYQPLD